MDSELQTGPSLVLTETGQMVDSKTLKINNPIEVAYRNSKPFERIRQEAIARQMRSDLNKRNSEIKKVGQEDPETASLARNQIVSLGENRTGNAAWTPLLDDFETLIQVTHTKGMEQLFTNTPPYYKYLPEEVVIGNKELPHTLTRVRLVDIENQDGTDVAVVIPNIQRDSLALHYSGSAGPNETESGEDITTVMIDTSQVRPDEMLRRPNGQRLMLDEQNRPADLIRMSLDEYISMWIVTRVPEKAIVTKPELK